MGFTGFLSCGSRCWISNELQHAHREATDSEARGDQKRGATISRKAACLQSFCSLIDNEKL